ncbi:hypothetical protein [Ferroplasma sp.]|uniref:hypothetical protein n=1 Tax=Ferroplasma sp. TaxID=2591003 RepID=UPI00307D792C
MDNHEKAAGIVRKYIMENYQKVENLKIRELKFDKYTENWTAHSSFNAMDRSYELALVFDFNKIIFAKEFI